MAGGPSHSPDMKALSLRARGAARRNSGEGSVGPTIFTKGLIGNDESSRSLDGSDVEVRASCRGCDDEPLPASQ